MLAAVLMGAAWLAAGWSGLLVVFLLSIVAEPIAIMRDQRRASSPGSVVRGVVGSPGEVVASCSPLGQVRIDGEYWPAVADGEPLQPGTRVVVTALEGLTVRVKARE